MATKVNAGAGVARFLALLVAISGLGYGVVTFTEGPGSADAATAAPSSDSVGADVGRSVVAASLTQPAAVPVQEILPAADPLPPDPALLQRGDRGRKVRILQARLRQLGWYAGDVTNHYGRRTAKAVKRFQARHKVAVSGAVDLPTIETLRAITRRPTKAELANRVVFGGQGGGGTWTTARLDKRCRVGHVLCVDKSSRTIRWVVGGEVRKTMAVRFGAAYTPTREGVFGVGWKSRDHVSKLFDTAMPFAMFFSGGQAVHYSPDFASKGYSGASHGCVNVRDYAGIKWLFDHVQVGDKVVVYWS